MPQKPLDALEKGMVLVRDIRSSDGRLLLPAGTELVQHHLDILRRWQIRSAHVKDAGGNEPLETMAHSEPGDPAAHIRNERYLSDLFRLVDRGDPVMEPFFRFLHARLDKAHTPSGKES